MNVHETAERIAIALEPLVGAYEDEAVAVIARILTECDNERDANALAELKLIVDCNRLAASQARERLLRARTLNEIASSGPDVEMELRREWWLNHGCPPGAAYGDDGEMQCHLRDFKREPLDILHKNVIHRRRQTEIASKPEPDVRALLLAAAPFVHESHEYAVCDNGNGREAMDYHTPLCKQITAALSAANARIAELENELGMQRVRTASMADTGDAKCPEVLVPIPDHLWPIGIYEFKPEHPEYGIDAEGRKCLALDACIVPAVKALWAAGIVTRSCCCGHGNGWGIITIHSACEVRL